MSQVLTVGKQRHSAPTLVDLHPCKNIMVMSLGKPNTGTDGEPVINCNKFSDDGSALSMI